jgi:lysophospholipid acyltransferase (LPLAT)-like uncharacterized protein
MSRKSRRGDALLNGVGPPVAALLMRILAGTLKFKWQGKEYYDAAVATDRPVIFAFWHEDIFGIAALHMRENWKKTAANKPVAVMVSHSRDGEKLSRVISRIGLSPVRGSSSRGAVRGMIEFERWLKSSPRRFAAIALDGPRGPRREAKPGIALLARRTNAIIIPAAFNYSRQWEFNSWDRTKVPKPGAVIECRIGKWIEVPASETDAAEFAKTLSRIVTEL